MRSAGLLVLAGVLACGRGGMPPVEPPRLTDAALAAHAREDFLSSCAPCHGADGQGGGAVPGGSTPRAPDLTRLAERLGPQFSHQYVADVITGEREVGAHGRRDMPVWNYHFGRVDSGAEAVAAVWAQRRLDALVAYVESLQTSAAPPATP